MLFYLMVRHLTVRVSDIRGKAKKGEDPVILDGLTFRVQKGEIFGITGPNGCGKSTLLRTVAGLVVPSAGEIVKDDKNIMLEPPHCRKTAMVFQDFALYPGLSSKQNMAYPLYLNGKLEVFPGVTPDEEIMEIARKLSVDSRKLLDRKPKFTSLGERQRVAIGKALASKPDIILLDEPFSNIEENLRNDIRSWMRKYFKENGMTALFVSNNPLEVGEMADTAAVMNAGRIEQTGTYRDLYDNPQTLFVMRFIGETKANTLDAATVAAMTDGKIKMILAIRPEECLAAKPESSVDLLELKGKVVMVQNMPQEHKRIVFIEHKKELFGAVLPPGTDVKRGEPLSVFIPLAKAKFFEEINEGSPKRVYNLW